jgi:hypothetical protein
MANSFVRYTGNGSTTAYAVPFSYVSQTHVAITISGVANTDFTWNGAGTQITFDSAPAADSNIEIRRTTSQTTRLVDYASGSVLTESDLDTDSTQGFYMSQEAVDDANDVIKTSSSTFQWDGTSKRITNVTDPTGAQDAATKNYTDTAGTSQVTLATTQATNAATSATAAATSATGAATSATTATTKASEASTSATNSASSASTASGHATTASGHATTATTQASNASTSASTATTQATTATTQATNAASSATAASSSQSAAATSATAAAASADNFDDTYLGAKSSDPSVDNDGDALSEGDLYFNTTTDQIKFWTGSSWTGIGVNTDVTTKVSSNDTTAGYLVAKLTATGSTGITLTETGDGGSETLNVTAASVPNASLANSTITLNGSAVALGGSATIAETKPTVSSISPSAIPNTATAVTITGTNFVTVPQVEALNPSTGIWYVADSVSFTNVTTIVATFTLAVDASYKLRIENPDGLSVLSSSALLTVSDVPTWSTTAGSLGNIAAGAAVALDVDATSDSTVAFTETTSILTSNANTPASTMNLTLNSSTGAITGTAPSAVTETTYNFTLRATDGESQTTDRAFSITITVGMNNSGQFN